MFPLNTSCFVPHQIGIIYWCNFTYLLFCFKSIINTLPILIWLKIIKAKISRNGTILNLNIFWNEPDRVLYPEIKSWLFPPHRISKNHFGSIWRKFRKWNYQQTRKGPGDVWSHCWGCHKSWKRFTVCKCKIVARQSCTFIERSALHF